MQPGIRQKRWVTSPSGFGMAPRPRSSARLAHDGHGIDAVIRRVPVLMARIALPGAAPLARIERRVSALAGDLLQMGVDAAQHLCLPVGCIPALSLSEVSSGALVACVYTRKVDAPGAAGLRSIAEAIARPLARLVESTGAEPIALLAAEQEYLEARCRADARTLIEDGLAVCPTDAAWEALWPELRRGLELDRFQPRLAAAHNANVLAAVVGAAQRLGIEPQPWAHEARNYAGRWGSCEPLARWGYVRGSLIGELTLPVPGRHGPSSASRGSSDSMAASSLCRAREALGRVAAVGLSASLAFSVPRWQARVLELCARSASASPPSSGGAARLVAIERRSESGVRLVPELARARCP